MKLAPVRTAAPAETPVDLAACKTHLRVTHSDHDTEIGAFLAAAVERIDGYTGILGRCLVTQTWRQDFADWPATDILRLPFADIIAITHIKYSDVADAEQTLPSTHYQLGQDALSSFLLLRDAFTSPSLYDDRLDPVRVTFTAGYGAASAVPAPIKAAILLMVGDLYENREDTVISNGVDVRPLPRGVDALLAPYRRVGL